VSSLASDGVRRRNHLGYLSAIFYGSAIGGTLPYRIPPAARRLYAPFTKSPETKPGGGPADIAELLDPPKQPADAAAAQQQDPAQAGQQIALDCPSADRIGTLCQCPKKRRESTKAASHPKLLIDRR